MKFRPILSIMVALLLAVNAGMLCSCVDNNFTEEISKTIYVTADASEDGADGTAEHPFATLEAARDAVRTIERTENLGSIDVILSGTFYLTESFVLSEEDSGTRFCRISWRGSKDGAYISGAITLNENDFSPATDDFSHYFAEDVRGHILSVDLSDYGIKPTEYPKQAMFWKYSLAVPYVGDTRLTIARYPDNEYAKIYNPTKMDGNIRFYYSDKHEEHIKTWHDIDNIYTFGYFTNLWTAVWGRTTSFDSDDLGLIAAVEYNPGGYEPTSGMPFYWYNIPEELTVPGEYYMSDDSVLYYYPLNGVTGWIMTYPVCNETLFDVESDWIHFSDITFEDGVGSGLTISGDNNTVTDCVFRRFDGSEAVYIKGNNNRFAGCEIANVENKGLVVEGGDRDTLTSSGTVVINNYIHDFSASKATYQSGIQVYGCGITISHNELCNTNHQAISLDGNNHIVEYNNIHDVCLFSDDAGAIYVQRSYDFYGMIFRYNYIHDIGTILFGTPLYYCGCSGLYWDGVIAGQTAYGNVVVNATGRGIQASGGADLTIKDNLVIGCRYSIEDPQLMYDYLFVYNLPLPLNLLEPAAQHASEHSEIAEAFPTILKMNNDQKADDPWFWAAPSRTTITGNVMFCEESLESTTFSFGEKVEEWGTVKNNTINTYAAGGQPTVEEAISASGLEIPFAEMGRNNQK